MFMYNRICYSNLFQRRFWRPGQESSWQKDNSNADRVSADETNRIGNSGNGVKLRPCGGQNASTGEKYRVSISLKNDFAEAKAVDKIQALTNSIRAISTQTSMLSLNAAIEAARAGDQGRGFAVVASEIGDLANQSTEAVNSINTIVTEVSKSVKNMTDSINRMISFIDGNVIPSFSELSDVGIQYAADAKSFGESMDIISSLAKELSVSIDEIVYSIDGINNNIGNANDRISAIAGKNADIVKATNLSDDLLLENTKDSEKLNTIVHKFKY